MYLTWITMAMISAIFFGIGDFIVVFSEQKKMGDPLFDVLQIGIELPTVELKDRIYTRIDNMVASGLWAEVQGLRACKYSWELPSMSGIGYGQWRDYENGAISLEDTIDHIKRDTMAYAKRQMTWFRREAGIAWIRDVSEVEPMVQQFLH
jgi:tRNA dimethylallyltransferase